MPTYVYEARNPEGGCAKCRAGMEVRESLDGPRLEKCPHCGAEVFRVVQAPGLTHSRTDLHYRAKRAGFKCLKKVQKGEYESVY